MKPNNLIVVLALLCFFTLVKPTAILSQPLTDSTVNFYTLSAYYDHYYDSLIQLRGPDNMRGTGYKDYLRWKWFYSSRHGVDGDLGEIWESIADYYNNFQQPENYIDESDWQFIGPLGIPLGHNHASRKDTGKGMMLSVWVSAGDHSLIYAGSHNSGLWKTTDGGNNWFPLHDNDMRITGVNSIAVDPGNYNTIYITCNSSVGNFPKYYGGLYKSIDGGINWDQLAMPPGFEYPTAFWGSSTRKIMINPDNPNNLFFITYRNVFRSENQGDSWENVFQRDYYPWSGNPQYLENHNGFFDYKITPWQNDNIAYLAGSEIFRITDPEGSFTTENISDDVFPCGLNTGDVMINHPNRCEISMNKIFPNIVWFCYICDYDRGDGQKNYLRIIRYDSQGYHVIYDHENVFASDGGASGDKLEFTVSSSNENIFYFGGLYIMKVVDTLVYLSGSNYPGDCWVHDDIRDMLIFSDEKGNDVLYLANDAGISLGTPFEPGETGCGNEIWHWRSLFESIVNGLNVTEFYGIGLSEQEPNLVAGGCQDLNDMLFHNDIWINFGNGDGTDLVFDPKNPNIFYYTELQASLLRRTDDYGETYEQLPLIEESSTVIPLEIDPLDPSILYTGSKKLLKFTGVNDFSQSVGSPIVLGEDLSNDLTDIEVISFGFNQRKYYVSTTKKYDYNPPPPPSGTFTGGIFTSSDGVNFRDITANLDACRFGFISDIEVNPYDTNQIWVCAAGYSKSVGNNIYQDKKVFTIDLSIPGNNWIDFSQDLPLGMPVYKISYLAPLGILLASTDVGIFKRSLSDIQWYEYNTNMPKKVITDIEVNIPYHKVVAATFGRGLWETQLEDICSMTEPPIYINTHVTWTAETLLKGDIKIQNGGSLEIVNCGVFMPANARIIVMPGGKLTVSGGTITSSCTELWGGIEVWGTNNFQYFSEYFGQVYLKNHAVIENARVGIYNYGIEEVLQPGGIIFASDATFRNNQIAVYYRQFANMYLGREHPYRSSFTRCKFEFNQARLPGFDFEYFIEMDRVSGIRFYACDFNNSIALTGSQGEIRDKYGSGIYSCGSQFYVDQYCINPIIFPCTQFKPSTFNGLNYGIYAMGIDPVYTISVNKSIFRDNITGIFISGINNATVTSNEFYVNKKYKIPPVPYNTYVGLYLDFCTGFTVEENFFTQEYDDDFHNFGIVVKDAGENSNEIYNNQFTNKFEVGIMALNKNRNRLPYQGLVIKCNEFAYTGPFNYDILVMEEGTPTENSGIAANQGSNANATTPAGNLFSRPEHPLYMDYTNTITRSPINYFMHEPNSNIRVKPLHYSQNTISLNNTSRPFIKAISCPSHLISQVPDPGTLKSELALAALKIDSTQAELNIWVDGGNTEQVVSNVNFSMPPDAYDLYSDLIIKSPYLSDTVLKESIQKENVLDNVMIEDILVANPQSAKSVEIQENLDSKSNPLSEDQRELVDQGKYVISGKEILESHVAWQKHNRGMILDDLIALYKNDTMNAYVKDSLIALLNNENAPDLSYQLAFIRLNEGDSMEAFNLMINMENSYEFNNSQSALHQQYENYARHYSEIVNSNNSELVFDSLSRSALYALAEAKTFPGVYSRNMMQFFDTLEYIEPYVLPAGQVKTGELYTNHGENKEIINEELRIYPNPAMSYYIVDYSVQKTNVESLELFVNDISGSILQHAVLPGKSGHKIISTKELNPGLYLCKFVLSGKVKQTIKLSVIK